MFSQPLDIQRVLLSPNYARWAGQGTWLCCRCVQAFRRCRLFSSQSSLDK